MCGGVGCGCGGPGRAGGWVAAGWAVGDTALMRLLVAPSPSSASCGELCGVGAVEVGWSGSGGMSVSDVVVVVVVVRARLVGGVMTCGGSVDGVALYNSRHLRMKKGILVGRRGDCLAIRSQRERLWARTSGNPCLAFRVAGQCRRTWVSSAMLPVLHLRQMTSLLGVLPAAVVLAT